MYDLHDIIGFGVTVLILFVMGFFYRRTMQAHQAVELVVNLYDVINDILTLTKAESITIWQVSNSGGTLHPGTPFYMNVIHEDYLPPAVPMKAKYKDVPVDGEQFRILKKLMIDKELYIDAHKLPSGFLFRSFHAHDIKHARLYHLADSGKYIFYCQIATTENDPMNSTNDLDSFFAGISKIRSVFKYLPK